MTDTEKRQEANREQIREMMDMPVHKELTINPDNVFLRVTRVPGGWIYHREHTVMGSYGVFVPEPDLGKHVQVNWEAIADAESKHKLKLAEIQYGDAPDDDIRWKYPNYFSHDREQAAQDPNQ